MEKAGERPFKLMCRWRMPIWLNSKHDKMYSKDHLFKLVFWEHFPVSSVVLLEISEDVPHLVVGHVQPHQRQHVLQIVQGNTALAGETLGRLYTRYWETWLDISKYFSSLKTWCSRLKELILYFRVENKKHFLKQKSHSPPPGCSDCKMHWVNVWKLKTISRW